jgi:hypothetical protein
MVGERVLEGVDEVMVGEASAQAGPREAERSLRHRVSITEALGDRRGSAERVA